MYRLRLASGREVKASSNHRFLTLAWLVPLEDLSRRRPHRHPAAQPGALSPPASAGRSMACSGPSHRRWLRPCAASPCTTPPTMRKTSPSLRLPRPPSSGLRPAVLPRRPGGIPTCPSPYHWTHGRLNPLHAWFRDSASTTCGHTRSTSRKRYIRRVTERARGLPPAPVGDRRERDSSRRTKTAPKVYYASSSGRWPRGRAVAQPFGIIARIGRSTKTAIPPGFHVDRRTTVPAWRTFLPIDRRAWRARHSWPESCCDYSLDSG